MLVCPALAVAMPLPRRCGDARGWAPWSVSTPCCGLGSHGGVGGAAWLVWLGGCSLALPLCLPVGAM
eukprot:14842094-Alexandrium_andersonii.AAC.1